MTVVAALTGTIPVIAVAGITVKYKEAMLGGPPRRKRKSKARRSSKRNAFGGTSPI